MKITPAEISGHLFEEWRNLFLAAPHGHIFQHPIWAAGMVEDMGAERETSLYATRREGRLSTLGAFRFFKKTMAGLPVRMGRFLLHELADYNGFLSEEEDPTDAVLSILEETRKLERWDVMQLKDIPGTDPLLGTLPALERSGLSVSLLEGNLCPWLSVAGSFDEYLSKKVERGGNRKRILTKALKADGVAVLEETQVPPTDFRIDDLAGIEENSWKAGEGTGLFSTPAKRRFYQRIFSRLHEENNLQYVMFSLHGRPTAYNLGFYFKERWHFYSTAHRKDDAGGFGTASMLLTLKGVFDKNMKEIDFLRGAESHKHGFTPLARRNYDLFLFTSPAAKLTFDTAVALKRYAKRRLRRPTEIWPGSVEESRFLKSPVSA